MISIRPREHGYALTLEGALDLEVLRELSLQMRDERAGSDDPFVLVIDARNFRHFTADAQACFEEMLEELLQSGLVRVTVLAVSTALANLFCAIMVRTEVMPMYQFLDLEYENDYQKEMENWLNEPFDLTPNP
jgi:hypothetical protein